MPSAGTPVFGSSGGAFASTLDLTVDFGSGGADKGLLVNVWAEGSLGTTVSSIVVDPAGANVALTLSTGRSSNTTFGLQGQYREGAIAGQTFNGTKTVRVTMSDGGAKPAAWALPLTDAQSVGTVDQASTSSFVTSVSDTISSATNDVVFGFLTLIQYSDGSSITDGSGVTRIARALSSSGAGGLVGVLWSMAGASSVSYAATLGTSYPFATAAWSVTGAVVSDLSGSATLESVSSSGSLDGGSPSTLTGSATLSDVAASGSITTAVGTFTSPPLKRNNGTLVAAGAMLTWLGFRVASTGAPVLLAAGVTLDGSSRFALADSALAPGTAYTAEWLESTGERGRCAGTAV